MIWVCRQAYLVLGGVCVLVGATTTYGLAGDMLQAIRGLTLGCSKAIGGFHFAGRHTWCWRACACWWGRPPRTAWGQPAVLGSLLGFHSLTVIRVCRQAYLVLAGVCVLVGATTTYGLAGDLLF